MTKIPFAISQFIRLGLLLLICVSCGGSSEPTSPDNPPFKNGMRLAGSLDMTCTEDIVLHGNYIYVADGPGGLKVVDASDHNNPRIVKTIESVYAVRLYIYSGYLYMCDGSGGTRVYSIADPENPTLTFQGGADFADSMAFKDDILYVGNYYAGFRMYNVKDPAHPVFIKDVKVSRVRDITFQGKYMLVSDNPFGVAIYQLMGDQNPVCVYTNPSLLANREDILAVREYIIIGRNDESSRICVFKMKGPTDVNLETEIWPAKFVESLTLSGDYLVASLGEQGIGIYSLAKLPALELALKFDTAGYDRRAYMIGDSIYACDMSKLLIYDLYSLGGDSE